MRTFVFVLSLAAIALGSGSAGFQLGQQGASRGRIVSGTLVMPPLSFFHEVCPRDHMCSMGQRYVEIPDSRRE